MSEIWYHYPETKPSVREKLKHFLVAYSNPKYITGKYDGDILKSEIPPYLPEIDIWLGEKWLNTNNLNIIGFAEIPKFRFSSDFKEKIKLNFPRQLQCVQREIYMREKHYPQLVARGKMSKSIADGELAAMREIEQTIYLAQRKNLDKPWNQE